MKSKKGFNPHLRTSLRSLKHEWERERGAMLQFRLNARIVFGQSFCGVALDCNSSILKLLAGGALQASP